MPTFNDLPTEIRQKILRIATKDLQGSDYHLRGRMHDHLGHLKNRDPSRPHSEEIARPAEHGFTELEQELMRLLRVDQTTSRDMIYILLDKLQDAEDQVFSLRAAATYWFDKGQALDFFDGYPSDHEVLQEETIRGELGDAEDDTKMLRSLIQDTSIVLPLSDHEVQLHFQKLHTASGVFRFPDFDHTHLIVLRGGWKLEIEADLVEVLARVPNGTSGSRIAEELRRRREGGKDQTS